MFITPEKFTSVVREMSQEADQFIRKDGFVQETILGINRTRGMRVQIVAWGENEVPDGLPGHVVPLAPPLRDQEDRIRRLFAVTETESAIWRGEVWLFPDSDPSAGERFMSGVGPSPSEHPERVEAVMTAGFWPLQGVAMMEGLRIVRAPGGDYTRPLPVSLGSDEGAQSGLFTVLASWLEHTLPQPDNPPPAATL